jgi:kynurenine formamidase
MVPAEILALSPKVRNWGRWGADDELGTLNLITPAKRAQAASLVTRGAVFALGLSLDAWGPQAGVGPGPRRNIQHMMTRTADGGGNSMGGTSYYTDDMVVMHLQGASQWDALAHVYYDGTLYNGYPASDVTSLGAARCGIDKVHDRLISRAVLLDIAALHGVDTLAPGHAIHADELDAAMAKAGVEVTEGDIVLVRTGLMGTHKRTRSWSAFDRQQPGIHYDTAPWFHERGVAAVAADNTAVEKMMAIDGVSCPFHMLALVDMGMPLGEYWDFEALAADCAADGRYEFLLSAPALPIAGAVGTPVNPIVMK